MADMLMPLAFVILLLFLNIYAVMNFNKTKKGRWISVICILLYSIYKYVYLKYFMDMSPIFDTIDKVFNIVYGIIVLVAICKNFYMHRKEPDKNSLGGTLIVICIFLLILVVSNRKTLSTGRLCNNKDE